jgi:hypothetical protein
LSIERELSAERIDDAERDRDLLTRTGRQRLQGQPGATTLAHQIPSLRTAMVIEHRLDPLLPLRPLMRERVPQPDPGTEIKDVLRWDP